MHFGPDESSEDVVMMNTPVVKAALEMGFSRSLVRQTVQRQILATGESYRTVSDLVSALLDAESERREEEEERQTEETASGIAVLCLHGVPVTCSMPASLTTPMQCWRHPSSPGFLNCQAQAGFKFGL